MTQTSLFTCLVLQKRVILTDREETLKEQQRSLNQFVKENAHHEAAILPGGCLVTRNSHLASVSGFVAALVGYVSLHTVLALLIILAKFSHLTELETSFYEQYTRDRTWPVKAEMMQRMRLMIKISFIYLPV